MSNQSIKKPDIQTIKYYDWDSSWEYLKAKYNFKDNCVIDKNGKVSDIWSYFVEAYEIHNGKIITLSNWELIHNDGEFAYLVPDWFKPILKVIIDEFGEPDNGCLTSNTKTVNFECSW